MIKFDSLIERWDSKLYLTACSANSKDFTISTLDSSLKSTLNNTVKRLFYVESLEDCDGCNRSPGSINHITLVSLLAELDNYIYNNLTSELESLIESKCKLLWLEVCIAFDFLTELATEIDFEPFSNPLDNIYSNFLETINEYIVGDEMSEERDILGLSVNLQIGDDPGNEMTTFNEILDIPNDIETFLGLDSVDLVHEMFGLDSPELGEISPSFDLSIPVKSM